MTVGVLIEKLSWSAEPACLDSFCGQRSGVAHVSTRVGVVDCEVHNLHFSDPTYRTPAAVLRGLAPVGEDE